MPDTCTIHSGVQPSRAARSLLATTRSGMEDPKATMDAKLIHPLGDTAASADEKRCGFAPAKARATGDAEVGHRSGSVCLGRKRGMESTSCFECSLRCAPRSRI